MAYTDKRDHYRIADDIEVTWKIVHASATSSSRAEDHLNIGPSFGLLSEIYQLDLDAGEILRSINEHNRQLGAFLHNLNRRMELASRAIFAEELHEGEGDHAARLSEGGISFVSTELLTPGTTLALKMLFHPNPLGLACFGEVRHCRLAEAHDGYLVGVSFMNLDEATRTLIRRHILHRQADERRERLRRDAGI